MKINGNIPIDDKKPDGKVREVNKNHDVETKDNAGKTEDGGVQRKRAKSLA